MPDAEPGAKIQGSSLLLFGGAGQVCWAIKSTCWIFGTKIQAHGGTKGVCSHCSQGLAIYIKKKLSILRQKKHYW
jgi:hypothetical protein